MLLLIVPRQLVSFIITVRFSLLRLVLGLLVLLLRLMRLVLLLLLVLPLLLNRVPIEVLLLGLVLLLELLLLLCSLVVLATFLDSHFWRIDPQTASSGMRRPDVGWNLGPWYGYAVVALRNRNGDGIDNRSRCNKSSDEREHYLLFVERTMMMEISLYIYRRISKYVRTDSHGLARVKPS